MGGTGDGEEGKLMCVMGTPVDGGGKENDTVATVVLSWVEARAVAGWSDGCSGGADR